MSKTVKQVGKILREKREHEGLTREALARQLKISAAYVAYLEYENPAAKISDRLYLGYKKILHIRDTKFFLAVQKHNSRVLRYRKRLTA